MIRCFIILFIVLASLLASACRGQSLTGMMGLLNVPTAEFQPDGTFFLGCSYLDKTYSGFSQSTYSLLAYYGNITILPFVEIGLRSTVKLGTPEPFYVDRMPSIRLRVIQEKKYIPAMVVGMHDFFTSVTISNQFFGASYLAASKQINLSDFQLGLHGGYGFELFRHNQFAGPFGGISLSHEKLNFLILAAEYDSREFNLGAKLLLFKHLQLLAVWQGLRAFSCSVAYRVFLIIE